MFLPISLDEGKRRSPTFSGFDVVFVTGDPYYDHPLSGVAILSRLLDTKGYSVGIVAQPETDAEFLACGVPRLCFLVTTGLLDSTLANYTPMLKKREGVLVPEHGLILYTQRLKALAKGSIVVLGGVEATIRRHTHFDYKENKLRRPVLLDAKADLLLFGNAERSLLILLDRIHNAIATKPDGAVLTAERLDDTDPKSAGGLSHPGVADRRHVAALREEHGTVRPVFEEIKDALDLPSLDGITYLAKEPSGAELPSYEVCVAEKEQFSLLARITYLLPDNAFFERCGKGLVRHNRPSHPLTEEEMDLIYSLPFERRLHPFSKHLRFNEEMVGFLKTSVVLGRGCWGGCSFCIIPLVQGKNIAKRSVASVLREIETLYAAGEKQIADLTLPTLNMYGSSCDLYDQPTTIRSPILDADVVVYEKVVGCNQQCVGCPHRKLSDDLIPLLEGVKKLNKKYSGTSLELRSALRHDSILGQKQLFREVMHFISRLKIAPEHISENVLRAMRKADKKAFDEFLCEFETINREQGTKKRLVPYFVAAHPGSTIEDMRILKKYCDERKIFVNLTQVFTPTPGTLATAMYWSGENPITKEKLYVPRTFREKKDQKNALVQEEREFVDENG